ncbi:formate dehydrogenase subunit gamma [Campylobacter canadensis]|uniref:Formate dehydrogenase subunit gamma n=1 Tax=Campylobacter canadensis TaxID=449520 RepID=A0ABS7WRR9_9BACT|nr:formate dehydrogenase subunit gamma [Campylobacter canadensis]MBZ7986649.1 formate dehydrogenase subunit gamma [Campylobacter canadensis]MBZ7993946.1 formate dehydrogenase subunit gamma [Campylobacter canadensis]MBZ7996262.1 formate dehydrogenase subunit gamma [Campylobacter canadensis]MBZ7997685.1 formate dehydrogenase subunit gamma [Campylobacter canadensis]MBZ7999279.1 formate dehydrogenase subunit gamma [Campylobacter canadensis]
MNKIAFLLFTTSLFASDLTTSGRITNITQYELGHLWTSINPYFAPLALIAMIAVLSAFALHYMVIGPKKFSHDGNKIYAFSMFERIFHLIAAISWIILIPTGLIIMNGHFFNGGLFVRTAKNLHGIATILFLISILPMFFCWIKRMLPASYDIKWLMIVGGYLSKVKKPVPAGKFNFGQKMWYYIAVFGGAIMIITGAFMFFLDFQSDFVQKLLGISHINILRLSAITHNILGILCLVMFLVHLYMAVFAIKGSIHSMITGYKEEEEVYILHSKWYQELKDKNQIKASYEYEKNQN